MPHTQFYSSSFKSLYKIHNTLNTLQRWIHLGPKYAHYIWMNTSVVVKPAKPQTAVHLQQFYEAQIHLYIRVYINSPFILSKWDLTFILNLFFRIIFLAVSSFTLLRHSRGCEGCSIRQTAPWSDPRETTFLWGFRCGDKKKPYCTALCSAVKYLGFTFRWTLCVPSALSQTVHLYVIKRTI